MNTNTFNIDRAGIYKISDLTRQDLSFKFDGSGNFYCEQLDIGKIPQEYFDWIYTLPKIYVSGAYLCAD